MNMKASPRWNLPLGAKPEIVLVGSAAERGYSSRLFNLYPDVWWLHIVRYHGQLTINGREFFVAPGFASIMAPGTEVLWQFGAHPVHLVCHFRTGSNPAGPCYPVDAITNLQDDYLRMSNHLELVIERFQTNRTWAEVTFWDLLFELANRPRDASSEILTLHPAIQRVILDIDDRMGQSITARELSAVANISLTHLNRLFHATYGLSCMGFLRQRRVERARQLLLRSRLPITTIAEQVGVPNLQQFNKLMRHVAGKSPRELREQNSGAVSNQPHLE